MVALPTVLVKGARWEKWAARSVVVAGLERVVVLGMGQLQAMANHISEEMSVSRGDLWSGKQARLACGAITVAGASEISERPTFPELGAINLPDYYTYAVDLWKGVGQICLHLFAIEMRSNPQC